MKKILILAAVAGVLTAMTGCGSLRTPASGENSKQVYTIHSSVSLSKASSMVMDWL